MNKGETKQKITRVTTKNRIMKTTVLATLFTIAISVSGFSQRSLGVFDAVKLNDSITLATCLHYGLKANTTSFDGNTLLMEASRNGSYAAAALLLAHGAKVDTRNELGNTALMEATLRGDVRMATLLLQAGASTALINRAGETAVTIAEGFEKTAIARLFTEKGQHANEYYAKTR